MHSSCIISPALADHPNPILSHMQETSVILSISLNQPLCLPKSNITHNDLYLLWILSAQRIGTAESISVNLGCFIKLPLMRWLINNRNFFHTVLEAGSLRTGCPHGHFRVSDGQLLLVALQGGEQRKDNFLMTLLWALIPFLKVYWSYWSDPNDLLKAHLCIVTWRVR